MVVTSVQSQHVMSLFRQCKLQKNIKYKRHQNWCLLYLNNLFFYDKIRLLEYIRKGNLMKKIMNKINFAVIAAMASGSAMAASGVNDKAICVFMHDLHGVFTMLQTFCFIGAAFMIAGWAWGYISKGEAKMDDLKNKGSGLLVGFILLFSVGLVLRFLYSASGQGALGCPEILNW